MKNLDRQDPRLDVLATTASGASRSGWYVGVLVLLVAVAAVVGLSGSDTYRGVPELLAQTWRAQDLANLVAAPLTVWAWQRARSGCLRAHLTALGLFFWFSYSYAHLAFAAPFGPTFLLDVAIVAMAGFALLDGLVRTDPGAVARHLAGAPHRRTGWFLVVSSVGIAGLWLADISLGFGGGTPVNLHLGLLPNPTWVLDLGWVIPMAAAAGIGLIRGRYWAPLLAAPTLVALAVLSVAMLALTPVALAAGLGSDPTVRPQLVAFSVVFTVLGAAEGWIIARSARTAAPESGWLRDRWWPDLGA